MAICSRCHGTGRIHRPGLFIDPPPRPRSPPVDDEIPQIGLPIFPPENEEDMVECPRCEGSGEVEERPIEDV